VQIIITQPVGRKRPRGRAQFWNSNEISEMSAPTERQQEDSRARVEREAVALALLLTAVIKPMLRRQPSPYLWDADDVRYRRADNEFLIRRRDVDDLLDGFLVGSQKRAAAIADALLSRETFIYEFQTALAAEIRHAHTIAAVTARGGWAQMRPEDFLRLGARTRKEYAYLNGFARQIETGEQAMNGHIRARARRYVRAARSTYINTQHEMLVERAGKFAGVLLGRRVYGGDSRSERCDGCEREHDRGWQLAAGVAYIGSQECGPNCNCYLIYKVVPSLTSADELIGTLEDFDE